MNKDVKKIRELVLKSFGVGLKKGWYKFEDKFMTVNKWLKLSDEEKSDYKIGLTGLGKTEAKETDLLFNFMSEISESESAYDFLIKDAKIDSSGNVIFILTDNGEHLRKLYEISGLNFSDLLRKKLRHGINKMFFNYIVVNNDENIIQGQRRL